MKHNGCLFWLPLVAALTSFAAPPVLLAQQGGGTITGRVTERDAKGPIASAQVRIVGTNRGVLTRDDGTYRITGVTPGRVELRALRIGYSAQSVTVTVAGGETATADFALATSVTQLDVVTVTASGEQTRKRETGNSVEVVAVDSVPKAAISSFSELLTGRVPGVIVQQSGGTTGTGSRIRIRGSNSISLNNDPLIILDGIRVDNGSQSSTIDVGGQVPSRFDDLNFEDIDNVEVIKGPAAAALYGTAASNGVIQITTKHGQPGRTQWNMFAEYGQIAKPTDFPANFAQPGTAPDGSPVGGCFILIQQLGSCTPSGALQSFNPLVAHSPFIQGNRESYGINVSGGSDAATYYVAGNFDWNRGVYAVNTDRKTNMRANLHAQLNNKTDLSVNVGYLSSHLRLPQNDNNILGIVPNGLLGNATDDAKRHGYLSITPDQSFNIDTRQDLERLTASASSTWNPLSWLSVVGVSGVDYSNRYDNELTPPGEVPFADLPEGNRTSNPYQIWNYTANLSGTATYGLTSSLNSTSSLGAAYNDVKTRGTSAFGRGLVAGTGSLGGTTAGFAVGEVNPDVVTIGAYGQERLAWRDKVYLAGALRGDENSAFGKNYGLVYYPSVSLSWVINEEGFFPKTRWLSQLRLRSAFGGSGQSPAFRDAVSFYNPVAVKRNETDSPAVTLGGVGNSALKPEKSSEYEVGFDAGLFANRVGLVFTYYNKDTRDAIVAKNLPPSTGAATELVNLGKVNNKGWEASVDANVVTTDRFTWDVRVDGTSNTNKLLTLGADTTPIIFGLGGATQRHEQGFPLGGYWQRPYTFTDLNHNGMIDVANCPDVGGDGTGCELLIADNPKFLGSPFPKYEFSFNSSITIFKYFRVGGMLDRRSGYKLYNSTEAFRCASFFNCQAANDPTTPLALQARALASALGTDAGYIEDASFWKLRELSLTLIAPNSWIRDRGVSGLSLTIAGRNLKTWTNYTGLDPEINFTGSTNFTTADFLSQPPTKYWTARVNVNF
ncbi:MAG: TonB-dependent receptor domain-containing protein [Gemmatimonadaceae bacterium]